MGLLMIYHNEQNSLLQKMTLNQSVVSAKRETQGDELLQKTLVCMESQKRCKKADDDEIFGE
ncbi:hypothetical protein GBAR_LOCUS13923 [Geodia barretti]|uniref:Uncharacterized protein n=1 Tax=Geodia barretti TaxID=519541 RepID=A0AA35S618_GEOBA|nr:hypothetical protein GBAR_LOCUS13923 [Geodia barretti]